ncbi:hypothetical protein [Saccharopolyspora hattusasensis]|uniref:hypothetical protein n=1 Tax=Saccharopolyspora hattusasensis TaxID=1128679 RepID=UPI003D9623A5
MEPNARYADVICDSCQYDIMKNGWGQRFVPLIRKDFRHCQDCIDRVDAMRAKLGTHDVVIGLPLPFLSEDERREYTAVHEAAHAVVGTRLGMTLDNVVVGEHESDLAGGFTANVTGAAYFDVPSLEASTLNDYAAMVTAGVVANERWLVERGQDTHPNRLDVAYGGSGDALALEAAVNGNVPMRQVMKTGRADANRVIAEHWAQITTVARELLTNGRMDGDQVRRVVNTAHQIAPTRVPKPRTTTPNTTTSNTTTATGGNTMGIEEVLAAISNTSSKGEQIQGALAQVQQWAGEIAGHLHMALGESGQHEVQQVIALFQELAEQRITELHQLVSGAVSEIEQYGQRL